ncbi:TRAP transporter small permease [Pararhodobacter marinus]|uniref:TRAP transporter small permease n=1 Tax=Pararhodobacter marinus TaxID=2184063 RepID=UPI0035183EC1
MTNVFSSDSVLVRIADRVYALSEAINWIARRAAGLFFLGMLATMMLQVIARYAFDSPPFWTEELARWLMVWGGLLGASCAFHTHADPAMVNPPANVVWRLKAQAFSRFVGSWLFFLPVLWFTYPFFIRQIGRTSEGLEVSTAWMAAALPVALILILFHGLAGLGALVSPRVLARETAYATQFSSHATE